MNLDHLVAIDAASARISTIARSGDLATPVDHLNRWKVRDVVAHLGGVQRWATRIIRERSMAGPGFTKSKLDGVALCDWFDAGADELLTELRGLAPTEPCPNFNPGSERTIAWWARRQAHEATVHQWDIEKALDCVTKIPATLAADGIDEFLDVFVRTRGKQTLADRLVLQTTRPKRSWTLTPAIKPGRIDIAIGRSSLSEDAGETVVNGKPDALLLALWGRLTATEARLAIDGDSRAAESLLPI